MHGQRLGRGPDLDRERVDSGIAIIRKRQMIQARQKRFRSPEKRRTGGEEETGSGR